MSQHTLLKSQQSGGTAQNVHLQGGHSELFPYTLKKHVPTLYNLKDI